jgi:hypothetical protein
VKARNAARLLALVVLAAFALILTPAADAVGPDCKEAPTAESPGTGIGGWFLTEPPTAPVGESWQNDAPVFEHYGYAGYRWNTYDLGCGSDVAREPGGVIGTAMGNWVMQLPKILVGATNFVVHYAFHPSFLSTFDPLVGQAMNALKTALFDKWAVLFVAFAGLVLLWKIRRMRIGSSLAVVGWALIVFMLAAVVFQYPLKAGQVADNTVTTVLGAINRGVNDTPIGKDPADEVAQNLTSAILFSQWKSGEFGEPNSATANKYARPLWESQTLTWADKKLIAADPDGAGKDLLEYKAKQFEETAEEIKEADPVAYEYLSGKRGEDRFGAAFMALFAAVAACPFLLVSCMLIIAAFLLVRLAVIFLPVVATIGVAYQFRGMVKGLLNVVAAAVINCIAFGAGAAVTIYAIGVLLSPTNKLPIALRLIIVALLTLVMWVVLKPFRKLTQMVSPNHNFFGAAAGAVSDTGRGVQRQLIGLGKHALGSFVGNWAAGKVSSEIRDEDHRKKKQGKVSEEETVAEPLYDTEVIRDPLIVITTEVAKPAPKPAIGSAPVTAEQPRETAAATGAVVAAPTPAAVATRPAHDEVGPYQVPAEGGAASTAEKELPPPLGHVPVVDRPEYAGGSTPPKPSTPADDGVWMPGDGEPQRAADSPGIVDLRDTTPGSIDENGAPVWPLWSPDSGVTFDAANTNPSTSSNNPGQGEPS